MRRRSLGNVLFFATGVGLACCLTAAAAGSAGYVECCDPNWPYGGGPNDLIVPAGGYYAMTGDEDYHNVTVGAGATLDTQGYRLRACGALTNYGTITDTRTGGAGGPGGAGGRGQDPCGDSGGPALPEPGLPGEPGYPPTCPQGGQGGTGGGGGGGGGGAKWYSPPICSDAGGGNGGAGGLGGRGGGCVQIYAYGLDNQGTIEADGGQGASGGVGSNGQYTVFSSMDYAGGGGGGGAPGGGGNGGTVEVHYAKCLDLGQIHATGGPGGDGATGGASGTTVVGHPLVYLDQWLEYEYEGAAGSAQGGHGGYGERDQGSWAGDGATGGNGADGAPGQRIIEFTACPPLPPSPRYSFTDLGPAPTLYSDAEGLNRAGWVVGIADTTGGEEHAFLWRCGCVYDLGTLGGDFSLAYDINQSGQVVGVASTGTGAWHGFLWLPQAACGFSAGMNDLCPSDHECWALAINGNTNVVGWRIRSSGNYTDAFLWLCEPTCGLPVGMNDPFGCWPNNHAQAIGLNDRTDAVGWGVYNWSIPPNPKPAGLLWYCGGAGPDDCPQQPSLSGNPYKFHDINDQRQVIGLNDNWPGIWLPDPCLGCEYTALDSLSDSPGEVRALNEATDVVGWSPSEVGDAHACLWRYAGGHVWELLDLNECIPGGTGWQLSIATDINEAGQIVGYAFAPDVQHGFLLSPQECTGFLRCDINCDGSVNFKDINPFVEALAAPCSYAVAYPNCNWLCNCDINRDGMVNFGDINPFVACLSQSRP
jgi:probable HAF family extracellular repeat protein